MSRTLVQGNQMVLLVMEDKHSVRSKTTCSWSEVNGADECRCNTDMSCCPVTTLWPHCDHSEYTEWKSNNTVSEHLVLIMQMQLHCSGNSYKWKCDNNVNVPISYLLALSHCEQPLYIIVCLHLVALIKWARGRTLSTLLTVLRRLVLRLYGRVWELQQFYTSKLFIGLWEWGCICGREKYLWAQREPCEVW